MKKEKEKILEIIDWNHIFSRKKNTAGKSKN